MNTCPTCKGERKTLAFVCGINTGGVRALPCSTCNERGELTDDELSAFNIARETAKWRRDYRFSLRRTQREMAAALGLTLVQYSAYENGRIELSEADSDLGLRYEKLIRNLRRGLDAGWTVVGLASLSGKLMGIPPIDNASPTYWPDYDLDDDEQWRGFDAEGMEAFLPCWATEALT